MNKIWIALFLLSFQSGLSQDCKTRAANKPAESVRFPDNYVRSNEDAKANIPTAKVKPQLSIAENWIKGILKNFTGTKLAYSNEYDFDYTSGRAQDFYKATGGKGYYLSKMRFYAYYCYDDQDKIYTEGESGSNVVVLFNNVFYNSLERSQGVFTVNNKPCFELLEKSSSEGRIDYYEQLAMANVNDTIYNSMHEYILIRNSDHPVFLPITRKEYLEQLLVYADDFKNKEIGYAKSAYTPQSEAANKASFDQQLKAIDNSKNYTAEQMAGYRKRFIETWETEKQKFDKRVARIEKDTKETKEVLSEYLKKPQDWLDRTFQKFYPYSGYSAKGMKEYLDQLDVYRYTKEEETRTYVASINPAYFNKSLSADTPQLIMVVLQKMKYPHMRKVSALIHKSGALLPLQNLLK